VGKRRFSREIALQGLYQLAMKSNTIDNILNYKWIDGKLPPDSLKYSSELILGIEHEKENIIKLINEVTTELNIFRLGKIDLIIILIGSYEIKNDLATQPAVFIDECIELAKKFSEENSYKLINVILEKIAQIITEKQDY